MKFKAAALCPFTTFTVYLYVYLCAFFITTLFIAFFSSLFLQKYSSGEHVKSKRLLKSSKEIQRWDGGKHIDCPLLVTSLFESFDILSQF